MSNRGKAVDDDTPKGLEFTTFDVTKHAQGVADMWNASDANWPGTWTGGVPETAENVTREYGREECIETFLCVEGDAVGGFCKVMPDLDEAGVDYVALVNVPPSHQKKGIARRLLQRATALAVARASNRLDLHTWTANLNAVPLYKKIGFMWLPDTDIHMLNFMPSILRLDAAREFFAARNWYEVFRRPLDQEPDEDRWEGMKVFTYRFADSADAPADAEPALVVRIDREARAICALDTPAYSVSATASRLDPPKGGEVTMTWRVANHGTESLPLTIVAAGTEHLLIDHRESAVVEPGGTAELTATCRIAADAPEVKPYKPVPAVKSVLLIGGQVIELATGLRPRPAIEIKTYPEHITLVPGTKRTVQVRLRNRLEHDAVIEVRATGAEGLDLGWASCSVEAAAEGWASKELEIAVPAGPGQPFAFDLSAVARFDGSTLRVEPEPRHVFSLTPGTVMAAREKDDIRVENNHFRARLHERGAYLSLSGRQGISGLVVATAGPPFYPSEFSTLEFELAHETTPDGVELIATGRSKRWPGFVVRHRFRIGAGTFAEARFEVENLETDSRTVQFSYGMHCAGERTVLPLSQGLVSGRRQDYFPGGDDDESKLPDRLSEQWRASENRLGEVIGSVWSGELEEVVGAGAQLITPKVEVAPLGRLEVEPLWIWCGPGSWHSLRDLWRRRTGTVLAADRAPEEPAEPVTVRVEPSPLLATSGSAQVELIVEHAGTWALGGEAEIVTPEGWTVDVDRVDLSETTWRKPSQARLVATAAESPSSGLLEIRVRGTEFDRRLEVPVLSIDGGQTASLGRATEHDAEVWNIDAGLSQVKVVPSHGGAAVSWAVDGVEQLASDWPEVSSIAWLLPWHGGIVPMLIAGGVDFPGALWREEFQAAEVEEKDRRGLVWKGVKVTAESTHEDSRGFQVDSTTLALAGAPVLKHRITFRNRTGGFQNPTVGAFYFMAPGGSREGTIAHTEGLRLNASNRMGFNTRGTWAAAENPDSGAVVMVCGTKRLASVKMGGDGVHAHNFRTPEVPAGEEHSEVAYLVAAPSLEAALPWRALTELD